MVDVAPKAVTAREARARAEVTMLPSTMQVLLDRSVEKGDVLAVARIAGIQAAKRTPELIPLCHQIALTSVELYFEPLPEPSRLRIEAVARATDRTGVEMEALTAVSVAALTVYDMLKAQDRAMVIEGVRLESKRGGKSGDWSR